MLANGMSPNSANSAETALLTTSSGGAPGNLIVISRGLRLTSARTAYHNDM